ncbi:MAG: HEPN domain-containing protein [Phycisphaerae bacterium]
MNPLTREWIDKAEADYATPCRELRARKDPNYDGGCSHAQQCAEKYLKAGLQEADVRFGKTRDLSALLGQILLSHPEWETLRTAAKILTGYGVEFRYPGKWADKMQARKAIEQCTHVRNLVRRSLGLPASPSRKRLGGTGRRKSAGKTRRNRR